MRPLTVLLEGSPTKQRLNALLESKKVPLHLGARLRRRVGINCDPNDCCVREVTNTLAAAAQEIRREHLALSGNAFPVEDPYQILLLVAALSAKSEPPDMLRDRRESDCIDFCDMSMPDGPGWLKLIDGVSKSALTALGGRRWLLWVASQEESGKAIENLALSRSKPGPGSGAAPLPTGEILYLSPHEIVHLGVKWPDLLRRLQTLALLMSEHYFLCELWNDVKKWGDLKEVADSLAPDVGKWLEGGPNAFLKAIHAEPADLGRLRVKMPSSLQEVTALVYFRNDWRLWANFHDRLRNEEKVLRCKRRSGN